MWKRIICCFHDRNLVILRLEKHEILRDIKCIMSKNMCVCLDNGILYNVEACCSSRYIGDEMISAQSIRDYTMLGSKECLTWASDFETIPILHKKTPMQPRQQLAQIMLSRTRTYKLSWRTL